ncbi:MAG: DUF3413 domain-containing protein, partial [Epsilonproteobacteria bacterium]|nr:DUF3413 domain-containing protein [Campylobacterota bacterium]
MNKRLSFFLKINFFITILILVMFLVFNKEYTPLSFLLTLFGAISTAALLYLLVYILFFPLLFTNKIGFYVVGLVVGAINFIILSDFFIYKIFNFHINGMVLNILTSPDAFDSIQVGKSTILAFIILVATFIILEIWLIRRVNEIRNAVDLNKRINKKIILPLFLIVVGEKITSGVFELLGKEEEISNLEVIPFYQPLPFSQLASYFGFKSDKVHLVVNRDSKIE